jgi:hypothetical protein
VKAVTTRVPGGVRPLHDRRRLPASPATLDGRRIRCHRLRVVKTRAREALIDVRLEGAEDPLVLVLDVGSTSSRAAVYDATATVVRGLNTP